MANIFREPLSQITRPTNGGASTPQPLPRQVLKALHGRLLVTLNTPAATTPAATPRGESPHAILTEIALDLGGVKRYAIDGGALRVLNARDYKGAGFIAADLTAPAAGASKTIEVQFIYDMNWWWARDPASGLGLLPLNSPRISSPNLLISWGDINDLFVTPNATTITSATLDVDAEWLAGIEVPEPIKLWEPKVNQFDAVSVTTELNLELAKGHDLAELFIKAMTDSRTLSDTLVNNVQAVRLNGAAGGQVVDIVRRTAWARLQNQNRQDQGGVAPATGYAWLSFVKDGRAAGMIGTRDLDRIVLSLDVAGAAGNRVRIYQRTASLL